MPIPRFTMYPSRSSRAARLVISSRVSGISLTVRPAHPGGNGPGRAVHSARANGRAHKLRPATPARALTPGPRRPAHPRRFRRPPRLGRLAHLRPHPPLPRGRPGQRRRHARLFGDAALASAFRAAYALPNLFRRLFGEGALSAAFLPEYTRLRQTDQRTADGLATATLWLLTLATGALTVVVEVILLSLLFFTAHDNADRALSFKLMMLMLPLMPAVCITAILGGILQAHGRFGPTAAAPIILNLFQIAAGGLFTLGILADTVTTAYAVAAAAVFAGLVQILWSLVALRARAVATRSAKARRRARGSSGGSSPR